MRNESAFWAKVRGEFNKQPGALLKKLPAEGFGGDGVPDGLYSVMGIAGVVELKYEPSWPVRDGTRVPVKLTENQRRWLEEWRDRGKGRAHVLLGVADEWFVMPVGAVPPPEGKGPPRMTPAELRTVRASGNGGTMKDLHRLPGLMLTLARISLAGLD